MYLENFKYNVQRVCSFHWNLVWSFHLDFVRKEQGVQSEGGGGEALLNGKKSIKHEKSYLWTIPKKSPFSKSLIVMKCFKY